MTTPTPRTIAQQLRDLDARYIPTGAMGQIVHEQGIILDAADRIEELESRLAQADHLIGAMENSRDQLRAELKRLTEERDWIMESRNDWREKAWQVAEKLNREVKRSESAERALAAREEELSRYKAHEGDEIVKELKSLYKWCSPQYGDPMKKAAARIVSDAVKLAEKEKELAAMKQRAEAAERKAEESARDAERYRWLRDKARLEYINPKAMEDSRMEWTFPRLFGMTCVMTEIPVDEAIDAAIAAKGEA